MTNRYLSFKEREDPGLLRAQQTGVGERSRRRMRRHPPTISRELRRSLQREAVFSRIGHDRALAYAPIFGRRPKPHKPVTNGAVRRYVEKRLAGLGRRFERGG